MGERKGKKIIRKERKEYVIDTNSIGQHRHSLLPHILFWSFLRYTDTFQKSNIERTEVIMQWAIYLAPSE